MTISPNVVILTKEELKAKCDASFQKGVQRGKFEAGYGGVKSSREERAYFGTNPNDHSAVASTIYEYFYESVLSTKADLNPMHNQDDAGELCIGIAEHLKAVLGISLGYRG